jgi:hypothetical protein
LGHRDLQDAATVRAEDGAGLSEKEDAIGRRLLEEDPLTLIENKFLQRERERDREREVRRER